jgi:hypothetical protein
MYSRLVPDSNIGLFAEVFITRTATRRTAGTSTASVGQGEDRLYFVNASETLAAGQTGSNPVVYNFVGQYFGAFYSYSVNSDGLWQAFSVSFPTNYSATYLSVTGIYAFPTSREYTITNNATNPFSAALAVRGPNPRYSYVLTTTARTGSTSKVSSTYTITSSTSVYISSTKTNESNTVTFTTRTTSSNTISANVSATMESARFIHAPNMMQEAEYPQFMAGYAFGVGTTSPIEINNNFGWERPIAQVRDTVSPQDIGAWVQIDTNNVVPKLSQCGTVSFDIRSATIYTLKGAGYAGGSAFSTATRSYVVPIDSSVTFNNGNAGRYLVGFKQATAPDGQTFHTVDPQGAIEIGENRFSGVGYPNGTSRSTFTENLFGSSWEVFVTSTAGTGKTAGDSSNSSLSQVGIFNIGYYYVPSFSKIAVKSSTYFVKTSSTGQIDSRVFAQSVAGSVISIINSFYETGVAVAYSSTITRSVAPTTSTSTFTQTVGETRHQTSTSYDSLASIITGAYSKTYRSHTGTINISLSTNITSSSSNLFTFSFSTYGSTALTSQITTINKAGFGNAQYASASSVSGVSNRISLFNNDTQIVDTFGGVTKKYANLGTISTSGAYYFAGTRFESETQTSIARLSYVTPRDTFSAWQLVY